METGPDVRFLARGSGMLRELIGRREAVSDALFGVFPRVVWGETKSETGLGARSSREALGKSRGRGGHRRRVWWRPMIAGAGIWTGRCRWNALSREIVSANGSCQKESVVSRAAHATEGGGASSGVEVEAGSKSERTAFSYRAEWWDTLAC